jgi:hypothetical protein
MKIHFHDIVKKLVYWITEPIQRYLSETTLKERDNLAKAVTKWKLTKLQTNRSCERLNTTSNEAFFQSLIEMRHILNPFTKKH